MISTYGLFVLRLEVIKSEQMNSWTFLSVEMSTLRQKGGEGSNNDYI